MQCVTYDYSLKGSNKCNHTYGVLFVNEKRARGIARCLTCGPHCELRQWFNRLVCSCPL